MSIGGRTWTIAAGGHRATVREVAAALQEYTHDGVDVTCAYGSDAMPPKACGITLVPWPNRIRGGRYEFDGTVQQLAISEPAKGNASHGLGRWTRFVPVDEGPEHVTLRLDVVPQNGYPFEIRADVTYRVDAERGLTVTTAATNVGATRAPFGTGHHPYLATHGHRLDDVTVELDAAGVLVTDESSLPIGRRSVEHTDHDLRGGRRLHRQRYDDCWSDIARDGHGHGTATVRTPSGGARLWFDAAYRYVQVFTVDELTAAGAGIALEPMTCPADAFNSGEGLVVLDPGARWTGSWGITPL